MLKSKTRNIGGGGEDGLYVYGRLGQGSLVLK